MLNQKVSNLTTARLLSKYSHVTLCPISSNPEKPSHINMQLELDREAKSNRDFICWYGDRKSAPKIGELFGFVNGFSRKIDDHGRGLVSFFEVVAILDGVCAPADWKDMKIGRDIVVLKRLYHSDDWCSVSGFISDKEVNVRADGVYTPMLPGMSRRKL